MNSQELKWQNASQTLLKLGGNGVNLLNQLNILTHIFQHTHLVR